jgi:hypothetical protein
VRDQRKLGYLLKKKVRTVRNALIYHSFEVFRTITMIEKGCETSWEASVLAQKLLSFAKLWKSVEVNFVIKEKNWILRISDLHHKVLSSRVGTKKARIMINQIMDNGFECSPIIDVATEDF